MSGSTIAIRSADLGSAVNVSAEIDDPAGATAGRSDPVIGLVSAIIALEGRATGSSAVGEMPAIRATGPSGAVRPMGSGSSTARRLSTAGRSDPVTGLVSATIALDGRATGSSTVGEMPAIRATGPSGAVCPMGSGSSTARRLSSAGRSAPVTGLVSATIALDGRATGSSTVGEMPAIGATGPSGAVRPMGSGSSRRQTPAPFPPLGWSSRPRRFLSCSLPSTPILLNQPQGRRNNKIEEICSAIGRGTGALPPRGGRQVVLDCGTYVSLSGVPARTAPADRRKNQRLGLRRLHFSGVCFADFLSSGALASGGGVLVPSVSQSRDLYV